MKNKQIIHIAVNAAIQSLYVMGRLNSDDRDELILSTANSMLEVAGKGVQIEAEDLQGIITTLVAGKRLSLRGGNLIPDIKTSIRPSFTGKAGQQNMLNILNGRVLYLYFYQLKQQRDEKYVIKFNIDGKGGIELPDGTITHKILGSLAGDLLKEKKLNYQIVTQNAWIVDHEHHPDASEASSKSYFGKYMKRLYEESQNNS